VVRLAMEVILPPPRNGACSSGQGKTYQSLGRTGPNKTREAETMWVRTTTYRGVTSNVQDHRLASPAAVASVAGRLFHSWAKATE
jgi:hypothetical protein